MEPSDGFTEKEGMFGDRESMEIRREHRTERGKFGHYVPSDAPTYQLMFLIQYLEYGELINKLYCTYELRKSVYINVFEARRQFDPR